MLAFDVWERLDEQMEQQARDIESARLSGVVRPYSVTELADIIAMEAEVRERAGALAGRLLAGRAATNTKGAEHDA